jgi:hypothetical protein
VRNEATGEDNISGHVIKVGRRWSQTNEMLINIIYETEE